MAGLALAVVFALSAFVATAAQAQPITFGPLWETTNKVLPKKVVSTSIGAFTLRTAALTIECKKVKDTGEIKKEGLDLTNALFEECEAIGEGLVKCLGPIPEGLCRAALNF